MEKNLQGPLSKLSNNLYMSNKIKPNQPCVCGSGKKYKKCCGRPSVKVNQKCDMWFSELVDQIKKGNKEHALSLCLTEKECRSHKNFIPFKILALLANGLLSEATSEAEKLDVKEANQLLLIGTFFLDYGYIDEAVKSLKEGHRTDTKNINIIANLGAALMASKLFDEAIKVFIKGLSVKQDHPQFLINLARSYSVIGKHKEGLECLGRIKGEMKSSANYLLAKAQFNSSLGNFEASYEAYSQLVNLFPENINFKIEMVKSLLGDKKFVQAESCLNALWANDQRDVAWYNLLFDKLLKNNEFDRLELMLDELTSELISVGYKNVKRGLIYGELGWPMKAVERFTKNLNETLAFLKPSSILMNTLYVSELSENEVSKLHFDLSDKLGMAPSYEQIYPRPFDSKNNKTRIGFITKLFRRHSVAFFLMSLFKNIDRERFEIFCYFDGYLRDDVTELIESEVYKFVNVHGMVEQELCTLMQDQSIDILVDIGGHSDDEHIDLFKMRPAPIQLAWLGYPHTTGIREIEYRVTDTYTDPVETADHFYTEKLIRLESPFLCYDPLFFREATFEPRTSDDKLMLCSFNNSAKISNATLSAWAKILTLIPNARLVIKDAKFKYLEAKKSLINKFVALGVDSSRLEIMDRFETQEESMEYYNKIDIALDTFPYCGTTTTFEALWMGVPVVSLVGDSHRHRVGGMILSTIDMNECIAYSEAEYIEKVANLAHDKEKLNAIKSGLRKKLENSVLMDGKKFSRAFENAVSSLITTSQNR